MSKARALSEATLGSSLKHPNVLATLGYSVVDAQEVVQGRGPQSEQDVQVQQAEVELVASTYILMELCDRGTLRYDNLLEPHCRT